MDKLVLADNEHINQENSDLSPEEINLLVEGPIWKAIVSMSVPMMLNALAISAATFADAYVAGKLGSDELAAVGIGGQVWFGMIIMAIAIASGANALVSRFWGAKDFSQAFEAARQSIFAAVIFGCISALFGIFCTDFFLHILGASEHVKELGSSYLKFQFLAQLPLTLLWVMHSIFRAKGDANLPTVIMAMVTITVVLLDFVLCLGPIKIGILGIGLSWLIASGLGSIIMFLAMRRSDLAPVFKISKTEKFLFSFHWFLRIMKIGLPACLQDLAWVLSNFGLFIIFSQTVNPTACQAAWAVGLRVEDVFSGLPIFAMMMGVGTVVGQNLGAGKLDRARKVGYLASFYGAILMTLIGAIMFFASKPIAISMSSHPLVQEYAIQYLQVLGISEPINAIWLILFGAMEGAGYTRVPMLYAFLCLFVIRIPLAYFLAITCSMAALGAWLGVALTSLFGALIALYLYQKNEWQHHKI